jgi:glycosyltransferase involved in cell wall biosynthesis
MHHSSEPACPDDTGSHASGNPDGPPTVPAKSPFLRRDAAELIHVSLVIPAYNEAEVIEQVVAKAAEMLRQCAHKFEIIVVDDCSRDETAALARKAGAMVVSHPHNRGYGNSLKTGIEISKYPYILITDGDGSYPLEQIPLLLQDAEKYDMIVGARQGEHFYGSPLKRMARWCQLALVNFVSGIRVPDANSGFRLIRKSLALKYFDLVCTGFSFTTSITLAMLCGNHFVKFVPIEYHKRVGRSHVRYFRDTLRSLQIITHCILKYNPLKLFVLLSLLPLLALPVLIPLVLLNPTLALILGCGLGTSLLVFSLGMVAYCIRSSAADSMSIDAGVFVSANTSADDLGRNSHKAA